MASFWPANLLTGGGTGALDAIDGGLLSDGDAAVVVDGTTAYFYTLDAASGAAESSPNVITPDVNAGDKRWILQTIVSSGGEVLDASNLAANGGSVPEVDQPTTFEKSLSFDAEYDNGTISSNTTIDWSNDNSQVVTLGADLTLSFSNMGVGHKQLRVVQDSTGGRTPTLPSGKWPGGTAGSFSTSANAEDILSIYYNGTSYYYQLTKGWS